MAFYFCKNYFLHANKYYWLCHGDEIKRGSRSGKMISALAFAAVLDANLHEPLCFYAQNDHLSDKQMLTNVYNYRVRHLIVHLEFVC